MNAETQRESERKRKTKHKEHTTVEHYRKCKRGTKKATQTLKPKSNANKKAQAERIRGRECERKGSS